MNWKAFASIGGLIFLLSFIPVKAEIINIYPIVSNPPSDYSVTLTYEGEYLISYKDKLLGLTPMFVTDTGTHYMWNDIPAVIPKVAWERRISQTHYKYGQILYNFTAEQKQMLRYFVYHRTTAVNITRAMVKNNIMTIADKIKLSFGDLTKTFELVKFNYTDIVFRVEDSNFELNEYGLWDISFDPIIEYDDVSVNLYTVNVTAENNFTHLEVNDISIIAQFPMNSNISSTTVYDYTLNNNDGTITGATYTTDGNIGGAYGFYGDDDYIGLSLDSTERPGNMFNWSVSAWMVTLEPMHIQILVLMQMKSCFICKKIIVPQKYISMP